MRFRFECLFCDFAVGSGVSESLTLGFGCV